MSKRSIRKRRHNVRSTFRYIDGSSIERFTIDGVDMTYAIKSISYTDYRERRRSQSARRQ